MLRKTIILLVFFMMTIVFADSHSEELTISRSDYQDRLRAFWLSQNIANWTGLQTEGDRITIPYYTDDDWRAFRFIVSGGTWRSDDDTDIEYIYQHALETYQTEILTPEQIRDQWLEHIWEEEENYLWVSNQSAYDLMLDGVLPPMTSDPSLNPNWEQIDAQLTTEIFGLFAPARPDVALAMGELPVQVTARGNAEIAAKFYIVMHSLAPYTIEHIDDSNGDGDPYDEQVLWLATQARVQTPDDSYIAAMYDWILDEYQNNPDKDGWEATRDAFHYHYIEGGADDYTYTNWYDSGSNFGLSIISLLYGQGDLRRTIQIGSLAGMDSDNPTATWGGLIGFLYGYDAVAETFGRDRYSDSYLINRTRQFEEGIDNFTAMSERGIGIIDRVVVNQMGGEIIGDDWIIPLHLKKW